MFVTYKYYASEHHMGRQVDLLQASIQSQLEGVNKETLLNNWLEYCLKNVLRNVSKHSFEGGWAGGRRIKQQQEYFQ